ncbi:MAG: serine protease [Anaeroplasmataceae bacterium]|nr:serine protease [Anaeroplasmataceae bacterium]MDE6415113.1 serine protease [Anaeroplasmataceae bacterium]
MKKVFFLFLMGLTWFLCSCSHFDIYKDAISKTVEINCQNEYLKSSATGALISNDGYILTNKHVVKDFTTNSTIKARFISEEECVAEIKYISDEYDLCLLKIEKETEYFSHLSEEFEIGEEVYTIGNPKGYGLAINKGIISSTYKNVIYKEESILAIQTSIEIYDGSSGGPLYNSKGELLGIMTFRIRDNGAYIPGMSFAIPTKIIKEFIKGDNIE